MHQFNNKRRQASTTELKRKCNSRYGLLQDRVHRCITAYHICSAGLRQRVAVTLTARGPQLKIHLNKC